MNLILKILFHLFVAVLLTIVTQIGGFIYLGSLIFIRSHIEKKKLLHFGAFVILYLLATFLIVPNVAPVFGHEKIKETEFVRARSPFYIIANRNYVRLGLNKVISEISNQLENNNNGVRLVFLDANFPFIDGFPLFPHLSHNDGKKVDVSLIWNCNK